MTGVQTCALPISGVVGGRGGLERDASTEPSRDRVGVDDGARIEHGACGIHSMGENRAHWMRGDALAVGDVCAVSCCARGKRNSSDGDDGRGRCGEREPGLVGGHRRTECDVATKPSRDGVGVDDGTRIEHGIGCIHITRQRGTHGMRGDGVAVGDVGAMHDRARYRGHTTGVDDCRPWAWQRVIGMVHGCSLAERQDPRQSSWDGLNNDDHTRIEHGSSVLHRSGQRRTHRMRGNTMGVGDVGEVSSWPWSKGIKAGGHDGRGAGGERDTGVVGGHIRPE